MFDLRTQTRTDAPLEYSQFQVQTLAPEIDETKALLRIYESSLKTQTEKQQYYEYSPLFESDQERLVFLQQPGAKAREEWLKAKQIAERSHTPSRFVASAIEQGDVIQGMSQEAVLQSWGPPATRAPAGDPTLRNERWVYYADIASIDGYKREKRVLVFEAGSLAGWETHPLD